MNDGMAAMTHRTTFALDDRTTSRIKSLAKLWNVSQAEVVRRAVSQADETASRPDPVVLLEQLHHLGAGLQKSAATKYLKEVRRDRQAWRGQ